MSDIEDLTTPEDDYISRRDEEFKKNFSKNCDALYADIARTVTSQEKDGYSEKFYIGPVDFNDGNSKEWLFHDHFQPIIYSEMKKRNNQAREKYEKGKAFAEKSGKSFDGKSVFNLDDITYLFHAYNETHVCVITNNEELFNYLPNENRTFLFERSGVYQKEYKLEKPMTERDNYHRLAYKYFIDKGVVKIDDEEEMIFGDELL